MRIGIEITPLTHTPTGVGYYVRHLLAALVESDHSFYGFASGIRHLDADHISIWYMRLPVPTRLLYRTWEMLGHPQVDRLLGGVDVYHAVNYVLPPVSKARRVLSIHDLSFIRFPQWSSPKIVAPFRRSIMRHAHEADAVIACSQATKNDIVSLLHLEPERVHVIYDAADPLFAPASKEEAANRVRKELGIDGPFFLFVGTIEPRKNITTLVEAFARADVPHRLVIAGGRGWNSEEVFACIERKGIRDRVCTTGYIQDRSLFPALYNAATALVFPSWYEGFGLPVLEALACGCPVIASNAASLPEVGGDAVLYADPEDVALFARHIEAVAMDETLRGELRERGRVQAARFSWTTCAKETLACYRSVV